MIAEMENYKFEVKRVTHLKAIDTITPCYFVILYLSWNSVTSHIWCHFWLQMLTKYSCFWVISSLIKQENWYLSNKVTFSSILLSSFDFHENLLCGRICYIIFNFFAKFHGNLLKKFEVIAYISNWAFFGCSQSCLCFLNISYNFYFY